MKLWIVKDDKGEVVGTSAWKREYAWTQIYRNLPAPVVRKALEAIGYKCIECEVLEPKEEEAE